MELGSLGRELLVNINGENLMPYLDLPHNPNFEIVSKESKHWINDYETYLNDKEQAKIDKDAYCFGDIIPQLLCLSSYSHYTQENIDVVIQYLAEVTNAADIAFDLNYKFNDPFIFYWMVIASININKKFAQKMINIFDDDIFNNGFITDLLRSFLSVLLAFLDDKPLLTIKKELRVLRKLVNVNIKEVGRRSEESKRFDSLLSILEAIIISDQNKLTTALDKRLKFWVNEASKEEYSNMPYFLLDLELTAILSFKMDTFFHNKIKNPYILKRP